MASVYVPKGTTDLSGLGIANGDSVYIMEGDQSIVSGTNLSGLTTLVDVVVGPGFTGNIVDLQCDLSGVFRYEAGGGSCSLIANGTSTEIIAKVEAVGYGRLELKTAGTFTEVQVGSGDVLIRDAVDVTNIRQTGGKVQQYYKSTANTGLTIAGGTFLSGRGFSGTANISGGTAIFRREDSSATVPTGGTLNLTGNPRLKWVGGNITALNLLSPNVWPDFTEIVAALTITDLTGFAAAIYKAGLPVAASGTAIMKSGKIITLTNAATQYGGKFTQYAIAGSLPPAHD